jgi:hypothetical protein
VTTVIFSNELCSTFTVMSSQTLLSDHIQLMWQTETLHTETVNYAKSYPVVLLTQTFVARMVHKTVQYITLITKSLSFVRNSLPSMKSEDLIPYSEELTHGQI